MQRVLRACLIFAVAASWMIAPVSVAEEPQSVDHAYAEMKEMFGGVPSMMQIYPKNAVPAGWAHIKQTDLNENTALSPKVRELVGLAVAARIPCWYCIYYHTVAAKSFGATGEEIRKPCTCQASSGIGARCFKAMSMTLRS
jgi:AhpD family alkylhydroperoxidase